MKKIVKPLEPCASCTGEGSYMCKQCKGTGKKDGQRCVSCAGIGWHYCMECEGKESAYAIVYE